MPSPTVSPDKFQALGESEAFIAHQERISRAAKTSRPVIFIGERGTGKELAAARLHLLSERWNQPYITLNCAALTPTLIESELFGHEAGSFTGAIRQRKGRFELAHGGSLFLDEVANIPMNVQEKILRVVEYGQMERVGAMTTLEVDARLIAATNIDLKAAAREGRFREDLLDRLSFEVIVIPPLRERREDILLLADHFARHMAAEMNMESAPEFSKRGRQALLDHPWPGNIRELKNVVERMVYRTNEAVIDEIVFDPFDSPYTPSSAQPYPGGASGKDLGERTEERQGSASGPPGERGASQSARENLDELPLEEAIQALEIRRIRGALEATQFNQRKAADRLGLTYHQFRGYYRKYREQFVDASSEEE